MAWYSSGQTIEGVATVIVDWHQFDWVATWKASSIMLTGAFGILGLATDFRNKHTKKITKWGYISLLGIVISTVCGTAAQLKESSDDAAKALAISEKSEETLANIRREISPLDEPHFDFTFKVMCDADPALELGCDNLLHSGYNKTRGKKFDAMLDSMIDHSVMVGFFTNPTSPEAQDPRSRNGNLQLELVANKQMIITSDFTQVNLMLTNASIDKGNEVFSVLNKHLRSDGTIVSLVDLPGTIVRVRTSSQGPSHLELVGLTLTCKNGQSIRFQGPFRKTDDGTIDNGVFWQGTIPK